MATIQEIQDHNANRSNLIRKAFGEEGFEKGGKKAVLGEIRNFGGRDYIKTPEGWKFHGKGTGEKAKAHVESTKTGKANVFYSAFSGNWTGTKVNGDHEVFYSQKEAEEFAGVKYNKEDKPSSHNDKSGAELKEKVDLAQGGAAGIRALMAREKKGPSEEEKRKEEYRNKRDREERSHMLNEKQTSKKEPKKNEKKMTQIGVKRILENSNIHIGEYGSAVAKIQKAPNGNLVIHSGSIAPFDKIEAVLKKNNIISHYSTWEEVGGFKSASEIKVLVIGEKE